MTSRTVGCVPLGTTEMESRAASGTLATRIRATLEFSAARGMTTRTTDAGRARRVTTVTAGSAGRRTCARDEPASLGLPASGRMHRRTLSVDRVRWDMKEMESVAEGIRACRIHALGE
uniref:(northern house mosquito) hypothetical protein n=1 Tax=Culex pipiens TaxID=7175 RepID=A0A8D8A8Z9_CULPI